MSGESNKRICFVITPIGDEGTAIRSRSDKVLRHVITPAAIACDYQVVRSDQESQPGMIGSQVIQHILEDPLVIADLTGHNPNVFYELAIRHVVRKPIVQIMEKGERLPFDVSQSRTIFLDHKDLDSAAECREEIIRQIRIVEHDPMKADNPITQAVQLAVLVQSPDPEAKRDAQIISMLQDFTSRLDRLEDLMQPPVNHSYRPNAASRLERSSRYSNRLTKLAQIVLEDPEVSGLSPRELRDFVLFVDTRLPDKIYSDILGDPDLFRSVIRDMLSDWKARQRVSEHAPTAAK